MKASKERHNRLRHGLVLALFMAAGVAVSATAFDLQYFQHTRLTQEGEDRHLRTATIPASRGNIVDRGGEILALSMPAYAVWADPRMFEVSESNLQRLAEVVELPVETVRAKIEKARRNRFVYLRRGMPSRVKERLQAEPIPGVNLRREYRRYYPMGEATAQALGLTDIDGKGIEGLELAFNEHLKGREGARRMMCDISGREIEDLGEIRAAQHGGQLRLGVDGHIQYRTWSALKDAVTEHRATSGSAVMIDVNTGDILALASYPGFDPQDRNSIKADLVRNRALIDVIEPGSTIKPFIAAMLLENGHATPETGLQTSPGWYMFKGHEVRDMHNYGWLSMGDVLAKSSNVGISRLSKRLSPEEVWGGFKNLGFGRHPLTGFPGEAKGVLRHYSQWSEIERLILSYGYGMSTSLLQLARAYAALAADGMMPEVNLVMRPQGSPPQKTRVFSERTARLVKRMLIEVVARGSGRLAKAHGYTTAGKTGTVRKSVKGGYLEETHASLFVGFAPATDPKIALAVIIDEPKADEYLGGVVAAPIFSEIVTNTLRRMRVPEDEPVASPMYRLTRKGA